MRVTVNGQSHQAMAGTDGTVMLVNGTEIVGVVWPTGRVDWVDGEVWPGGRAVIRSPRGSVFNRWMWAWFVVVIATAAGGCTSPTQPTEVRRDIIKVKTTYHACPDVYNPGATVWTNVWPCP